MTLASWRWVLLLRPASRREALRAVGRREADVPWLETTPSTCTVVNSQMSHARYVGPSILH